MAMNDDERIEHLLSLGHPEADGFEPRPFDVTRPLTASATRRPLAPVAGAAAVLAAVVVLAALNLSARGPAVPPTALPPASSSTQTSTAVATTAAPSAKVVVVTAENPERAVMARLAVRGTGCWVSGENDFLMDRGKEWEARIEATGIDHGWLDDSLWVGDDRSEVATAFGGTYAAYAAKGPQGLEEMWIVTERGGREIGLQLIPWHTPHGHTVWHSWNTVAVASCADSLPVDESIKAVSRSKPTSEEQRVMELCQVGGYGFAEDDVAGMGKIAHASEATKYVPLTGREPEIQGDGPLWILAYSGDFPIPRRPDLHGRDPVCLVPEDLTSGELLWPWGFNGEPDPFPDRPPQELRLPPLLP